MVRINEKGLIFFGKNWEIPAINSDLLRNYMNEWRRDLQGISFRNWLFKSALRDRRTNIFFDLWCLVASGGADICVSSTSFQKNDIGWPQQPPTERVSDISEKFDFWQSIPQKGTGSGHLGARDDQTIRISKFFDWDYLHLTALMKETYFRIIKYHIEF